MILMIQSTALCLTTQYPRCHNHEKLELVEMVSRSFIKTQSSLIAHCHYFWYLETKDYCTASAQGTLRKLLTHSTISTISIDNSRWHSGSLLVILSWENTHSLLHFILLLCNNEVEFLFQFPILLIFIFELIRWPLIGNIRQYS